MKLENMQAIVGAITKRPPWRYVADSGRVDAPEAGPNRFLSASVCEMFAAGAPQNASAIVALANHADALLELWRACENAADHGPWSAVYDAIAKLEAIQ